MAQTPIAVGLTLCENLLVEKYTNNISLINTFTTLHATHFPWQHSFYIFAVLTNAVGPVTMELVIIRLETGEEIYRKTRQLHFADKIVQVGFVQRVLQQVFPVAGAYEISLLGDGGWVAQKRLWVRPREEAP